MAHKLEAESISVVLAVDLTEARRNLQAESDELSILSVPLGVVYDDLEVVRSEGTSSLALVPSRSWPRCASSRGMPFALGSINPS